MTIRPVSVSPRRRLGFTLVEVLAVVAILLILAGIATYGVQAAMYRARVNEAKIKAQSIIKAAETHYNATNQPPVIQQLVERSEDGPPLLTGGLAAITDPWGQQFTLEFVPADAAGSPRFMVTTTAPDGTLIRVPVQ